MTARTYRLPGVAVQRVIDGDFGREGDRAPAIDADAWAKLRASRRVRRGFGYQVLVDLTPAEAEALGRYLNSVVGALESMTSQERGDSGQSELKACSKAVETLYGRTGNPA